MQGEFHVVSKPIFSIPFSSIIQLCWLALLIVTEGFKSLSISHLPSTDLKIPMISQDDITSFSCSVSVLKHLRGFPVAAGIVVQCVRPLPTMLKSHVSISSSPACSTSDLSLLMKKGHCGRWPQCLGSPPWENVLESPGFCLSLFSAVTTHSGVNSGAGHLCPYFLVTSSLLYWRGSYRQRGRGRESALC